MAQGRVLVVPDTHGCSLTLYSLLNKVCLEQSDTLVFLGDYICRGRDSKGVLELILRLKRGGYNIIPLLGNHEDNLINAATTGVEEDLSLFLDNGGDATLLSFNVDHPASIPQRYLDFIRSMPVVWQNATHVCVHGWLTFDPRKEPTMRQRYDALWQRSGTIDSAHLAGRTLVVGHSVVSMDKLKASLQTQYVRLDNGCVYGTGYEGRGSLVCLELESNQLFVQPNIDDPEDGRE